MQVSVSKRLDFARRKAQCSHAPLGLVFPMLIFMAIASSGIKVGQDPALIGLLHGEVIRVGSR